MPPGISQSALYVGSTSRGHGRGRREAAARPPSAWSAGGAGTRARRPRPRPSALPISWGRCDRSRRRAHATRSTIALTETKMAYSSHCSGWRAAGRAHRREGGDAGAEPRPCSSSDHPRLRPIGGLRVFFAAMAALVPDRLPRDGRRCRARRPGAGRHGRTRHRCGGDGRPARGRDREPGGRRSRPGRGGPGRGAGHRRAVHRPRGRRRGRRRRAGRRPTAAATSSPATTASCRCPAIPTPHRA
jgi:hypothetical protein